MKRFHVVVRAAAFAALLAFCLTGQTAKYKFSPRDKAFYADPALVEYVSPGLNVTINSASIASSGAITVNYSLTDPNGLPLDATGETTPGAISVTYFAAYIPQGQTQYVSYTTASATGTALGTITRPTFEEGGGTLTSTGAGQYSYVMKAQAPAGFDPTVTTTVAVAASRNLTTFNLGTNYAGATFNFVPNGAAVTVTRDVIRTASCNRCHDQLAFHGGHAFGMNQCVMCHQPQNQDPVTGNTLDLKVMAHKIHMGSQLPSVVGTATTKGVPYEIAGYMNSLSNFSTVVDPADPRRCEVCHDQTSGAKQAANFMTNPTRAACGACHDDINFATGFSTGSEPNHPAGPLSDDTQCANCHIPKGETPFDASILGAHVVPADTSQTYPQNPDTLLAGINFVITSVTNTSAGQTPTVNFTLKDNSGNNIALSAASPSFTMTGPTTDYGLTNFGSGTTSTPGYVTESATGATCTSGNCSYTFTHAIPTGATGTYTIGGEARESVTVLAGTTAQQSVSLGAINPVINFSVDGSPVTPRRTVVQLANCNQCHVYLSLHGGLRDNTQYCPVCHNPSNTDFTTRPMATVASYQTQPDQGINFALMVHRIHDGINGAADGQKNPYVVVGHGGSINDFSGVLYPAMSPTGSTSYTQNCSLCHVNSSEQNDLALSNLNPVTDPQGWINPVQPISSACSGCHTSKSEASHFLANTTSLGESCNTCHGSGAAFSVDSVHAQ